MYCGIFNGDAPTTPTSVGFLAETTGMLSCLFKPNCGVDVTVIDLAIVEIGWVGTIIWLAEGITVEAVFWNINER